MSKFTKVIICATSRGVHGQALLVFRHPTGGVQLPAGSVEPGEAPEEAALRELFEETSITRVQAIEQLRTLSTDLGSCSGVLLETVALRPGAIGHENEHGPRIRRGLPVRLLAEESGALHICYEELDYGAEPKVVTSSVAGWVSANAVARSIERVIFRAHIERDDRASWQHFADGQLLEVFWVPLLPKPVLVGPQQAWLDSVYEQLSSDRGE